MRAACGTHICAQTDARWAWNQQRPRPTVARSIQGVKWSSVSNRGWKPKQAKVGARWHELNISTRGGVLSIPVGRCWRFFSKSFALAAFATFGGLLGSWNLARTCGRRPWPSAARRRCFPTFTVAFTVLYYLCNTDIRLNLDIHLLF